jgi:hypothetical protein
LRHPGRHYLSFFLLAGCKEKIPERVSKIFRTMEGKTWEISW